MSERAMNRWRLSALVAASFVLIALAFWRFDVAVGAAVGGWTGWLLGYGDGIREALK